MKKILDNIKAIRAIKGYSQEYVADKLGCDYSTYGKIENGKSSLTVDRLFKLADILGVDVARLLLGSEEKDAGKTYNISEDSSRSKIILEIPINSEDLSKTALKDILFGLIEKH